MDGKGLAVITAGRHSSSEPALAAARQAGGNHHDALAPKRILKVHSQSASESEPESLVCSAFESQCHTPGSVAGIVLCSCVTGARPSYKSRNPPPSHGCIFRDCLPSTRVCLCTCCQHSPLEYGCALTCHASPLPKLSKVS